MKNIKKILKRALKSSIKKLINEHLTPGQNHMPPAGGIAVPMNHDTAGVGSWQAPVIPLDQSITPNNTYSNQSVPTPGTFRDGAHPFHYIGTICPIMYAMAEMPGYNQLASNDIQIFDWVNTQYALEGISPFLTSAGLFTCTQVQPNETWFPGQGGGFGGGSYASMQTAVATGWLYANKAGFQIGQCTQACNALTVNFIQIVPEVTYNCFEGLCEDPGDGSGFYSSLSACLAWKGCSRWECKTVLEPIALEEQPIKGPYGPEELYPTTKACVVCDESQYDEINNIWDSNCIYNNEYYCKESSCYTQIAFKNPEPTKDLPIKEPVDMEPIDMKPIDIEPQIREGVQIKGKLLNTLRMKKLAGIKRK